MKIMKATDVAKKAVNMEGAEGAEIRVLISKQDGAENFAMRMFEIAPGGHTPYHSHPHEHEVFIVEGKGLFVCERQEYPFESEHVIFVPGGIEHCFKNTGNTAMRFLCLVPASAS